MELVKNDATVQEKLKKAAREYTGERTPEAAFQAIISPVAQEHGIEITFQDYQAFLESNKLSLDEMEQVAGGEGDRDYEKNCRTIGVGPGFDWDSIPF